MHTAHTSHGPPSSLPDTDARSNRPRRDGRKRRFLASIKIIGFACLLLFGSTLASGQQSGFKNHRDTSVAHATTLPIKNPGVIELSPDNFDRVLAVSDIHGMYPQLLKLLQAANLITINGAEVTWTGGKALLIVTGDSIDKGPQSVEVVDLWLSLMPQAEKASGRILHLLGNHEAEFLSDPTNDKTATFRHELKKRGISIDEFTNPDYQRAKFLFSLPIAAKIGAWLFSHSGCYPDMPWTEFKDKAESLLKHPTSKTYSDAFFTGDTSILEVKKWESDPDERQSMELRLSKNGFVGSVFGHQPKALGVEGECGISNDRRLIKIDNGMAPEAGGHHGSILNFPKPKELNNLNDASKITVNAILHHGKIRELTVEQ